MISRRGLGLMILVLAGSPGCTHKACLDGAYAPAGEDVDASVSLPSASGATGAAAEGNGSSSGGAGSSGSSGSSSSSGASGPAATVAGGDPMRAIAEADIVELGTKYLYALSKSGSLAIVDVSVPGQLTLVGSTTLPGQPFEMYEQGDDLIVMCNEVVGPDGGAAVPVPVPNADAGAYVAVVPDASAAEDGGADAGAPAPDASIPLAYSSPDGGAAVPSTTSAVAFTDPNSAVVLALDVHVPSQVATLATFEVPGQIADSRMIGTILYLTTYQNGVCDGCAGSAQTVVTSFDVTDPTRMKYIDQAKFLSNAPAAYNYAWGMAWQRSIVATTQRLYLGGQAYVDPNDPYGASEGIIDVVDVSDAAGHLGPGAHVAIPGPILSRWQMDESNGILRVISEQGAGFTGNGTAYPEVDTFTIASTTSLLPLGSTTLRLPTQEGLRTVQFDGPRAYAITFNQTDPLFAIDLSNPAAPVQGGQIMMPGWMFYLKPMGNQVIGLGVDRTDTAGDLNVSLFDVTNINSPKMLSRVAFGSLGVTEDYQILNYELPEDQDNIQKAFRVFSDGLVAVPFSTTGADGTTACQGNAASGVQLMQLSGNTLVKHAVLPVPGNPKRAIELSGELLAVSDSDVRAFSLASLDVVAQTADVTIGTCVMPTIPGQNGGGVGGGGVGFGNDFGGNDTPPNNGGPTPQPSGSGMSWLLGGGCN
jgi:Beta propeller domain